MGSLRKSSVKTQDGESAHGHTGGFRRTVEWYRFRVWIRHLLAKLWATLEIFAFVLE
jgi:hypothetical protein